MLLDLRFPSEVLPVTEVSDIQLRGALMHSLSVNLSPVRLVCLGPQHPLHHETPPANGQRCRHNGDDHGHPS